MFATLAAEGISIQTISTSEVKVSCTINRVDGDRAVAALCQFFQVEYSPNRDAVSSTAPSVRGVALDRGQAQIGVLHIPDKAGMAAQIFAALADRNISVYTIVQSERCRMVNNIPTRDLSFTVNSEDADTAVVLLTELAATVGYESVTIERDIAKVSIVGAGMANESGVAAAMFTALADRGINILSISTSEIKTSCAIRADRAIEALQAVHTAFGLDGATPIEVPKPAR
jgi:aspartate kinase